MLAERGFYRMGGPSFFTPDVFKVDVSYTETIENGKVVRRTKPQYMCHVDGAFMRNRDGLAVSTALRFIDTLGPVQPIAIHPNVSNITQALIRNRPSISIIIPSPSLTANIDVLLPDGSSTSTSPSELHKDRNEQVRFRNVYRPMISDGTL